MKAGQQTTQSLEERGVLPVIVRTAENKWTIATKDGGSAHFPDWQSANAARWQHVADNDLLGAADATDASTDTGSAAAPTDSAQTAAPVSSTTNEQSSPAAPEAVNSPTENGNPNTENDLPSLSDFLQRAKAAGVQLTPQMEAGLRNGNPKITAAVEHLTSAQEELAAPHAGTPNTEAPDTAADKPASPETEQAVQSDVKSSESVRHQASLSPGSPTENGRPNTANDPSAAPAGNGTPTGVSGPNTAENAPTPGTLQDQQPATQVTPAPAWGAKTASQVTALLGTLKPRIDAARGDLTKTIIEQVGLKNDSLMKQGQWKDGKMSDAEWAAYQAKQNRLVEQAEFRVKQARQAHQEANDEAMRAVEVPQSERGRVAFRGDEVPRGPVGNKAVDGAMIVERFVHPNLMPKKVGVQEYHGEVSYCDPSSTIHINGNTPPEIAAHEIVHAIEAQRPEVLQKALAFRASRSQGEAPVLLSKLTNEPQYGDRMAYEDEWVKKGGDAYTGRTYDGDTGTEILTKGIERLHADPLKFAADDPEYFEFLIRTFHNL